MHLGRRLGARGKLEHDLDAVDGMCFDRRGDAERRRDEAHGSARHRFTEPRVDLPARPRRQESAELELRAARRRIS